MAWIKESSKSNKERRVLDPSSFIRNLEICCVVPKPVRRKHGAKQQYPLLPLR